MVIFRGMFMALMWLVSLVASLAGAVGSHRSRPGSPATAAWVLLAVVLASPIFLAVAAALWLASLG